MQVQASAFLAIAAMAVLSSAGPCQARESNSASESVSARLELKPPTRPLVIRPASVGAPAPDFELQDINGQTHRLSDYTAQGKTVVLEWFSPACPVCIAYYTAPRYENGIVMGPAPMLATHKQIDSDQLVWLLINSSAPGKPGHEPEENIQSLADLKIHFPLLLDPDGSIGRAYGAKRTPHLMVIDPQGRLVYRGSADEGGRAAPGSGLNFVVAAVQAAAAGKLPLILETQAVG
jgi:peroxiredoxin